MDIEHLYREEHFKVETWCERPGDCDWTEPPLLFRTSEGRTVARIPKGKLRLALASALGPDTRWNFGMLLGALTTAWCKEMPADEEPVAIAFPTWLADALRALEWGDSFFGLKWVENITNDNISLLGKRNFQ